MGQGLIYIEEAEGNGLYEYIAKRGGDIVAIGVGETVEKARESLERWLTLKIDNRKRAIHQYEEQLSDLPHLIAQKRQDKQALEAALRDFQVQEAAK